MKKFKVSGKERKTQVKAKRAASFHSVLSVSLPLVVLIVPAWLGMQMRNDGVSDLSWASERMFHEQMTVGDESNAFLWEDLAPTVYMLLPHAMTVPVSLVTCHIQKKL
jgi:hypothetical protein